VYQELGDNPVSEDEQINAGVCVSTFSPVAAAVQNHLSRGQQTALVCEIERWIKTTAVEQKHTFQLPSVEAYMPQRLGSSAAGVCLAILEEVYAASHVCSRLTDDAVSC
jgi:hypothetical protein